MLSMHTNPHLQTHPLSQKPSKRDPSSTDDQCSTPELRPTGLQSKKQTNIGPEKYKTQICKNYSETGKCPYRTRCRFAHGRQELMKGLALEPGHSYRTKKCTSFWQTGVCRYGFRCQFLHYEKVGSERGYYLGLMIRMIRNQRSNGQSRLQGLFNGGAK